METQRELRETKRGGARERENEGRQSERIMREER